MTAPRDITGNDMPVAEISKQAAETSKPVRGEGFRRSIGLFSGTAINMTQMCGIGPFITIPIMVAVMGGPQAIIGWIAGAILAAADGMVWAELGAAMPGSGGTYVYLREAFQYRTGKLMPFLFIWTVLLICAGCSLALFSSAMKFDSGTGWPSFFTTIPGVFATKVDTRLIVPRTEYHCVKCC